MSEWGCSGRRDSPRVPSRRTGVGTRSSRASAAPDPGSPGPRPAGGPPDPRRVIPPESEAVKGRLCKVGQTQDSSHQSMNAAIALLLFCSSRLTQIWKERKRKRKPIPVSNHFLCLFYPLLGERFPCWGKHAHFHTSSWKMRGKITFENGRVFHARLSKKTVWKNISIGHFVSPLHVWKRKRCRN